MKKADLMKDMEYIENKRCHLGTMIRNKDIFTYEELMQTLYGLTGVMYHILDDMRLQKEKEKELEPISLTRKEFEDQFCSLCGTQRCEGIDSEWFSGCEHKELLKQDVEQEK